MRKNWIAYVGPFQFPWGQPGSRRVCGVASSIAEAGFDVVVGCGGTEPLVPVNLNEGELPGSITYLGLGETPPSGAPILPKLLQLLVHWGEKTVEWLDVQPVKPSHVIVYGGSAQYMFHLLPWCRRNRIPLIADVVEWYDPKHMAGGFFGPFHMSAKWALHHQYPKCDGIIVISSYLAEHYRKKGCRVVCIPPTLDVSRIPIEFTGDSDCASRLTLVYAGTPGKKDLLGNVIRGIAQIDPDGERVGLLVMGPSPEQVNSLLNGTDMPPSVEVLGRVSQADVAKIIQRADFSVLLRDPQLFAQAGFPTKFVESMANGTPVIANLTSDLGSYLHDGTEGVICQDHSVNGFADALQRALLLSPAERSEMRLAARRQTECSFDFRNYTVALSEFFQEIRS